MANRKDLQIIVNKRIIKLRKQNVCSYGIPEKIETDKGGEFISRHCEEFCKSKNTGIEFSTPRLYTSTRTVERAIQTFKNLLIANMEDN